MALVQYELRSSLQWLNFKHVVNNFNFESTAAQKSLQIMFYSWNLITYNKGGSSVQHIE